VARPPRATAPGQASELMARYWVVGGEYTDTRFERLAPGTNEERHGPFDTYEQAHEVWQARARATVDNALVRFRILEESGGSAS
jgi:uncharacterized protein YndB with AHSA1/START domain